MTFLVLTLLSQAFAYNPIESEPIKGCATSSVQAGDLGALALTLFGLVSLRRKEE